LTCNNSYRRNTSKLAA